MSNVIKADFGEVRWWDKMHRDLAASFAPRLPEVSAEGIVQMADAVITQMKHVVEALSVDRSSETDAAQRVAVAIFESITTAALTSAEIALSPDTPRRVR
jgi:hypothetical protein